MTHAKNIKPIKNLRTKHVGGLAGSWLSRFADWFWIKNGTRVGVCSLSFAAETMCFGGPGHPLYVHRAGAMAAAATFFFGFSVFRFENSKGQRLSRSVRSSSKVPQCLHHRLAIEQQLTEAPSISYFTNLVVGVSCLSLEAANISTGASVVYEPQ
jgi:hypothetical protein